MNELEREGEEKIEQKPVPPSETGLGATFGWVMVLTFVAVWALLFAWLKKGTASMGVPALHAVLPYGRPADLADLVETPPATGVMAPERSVSFRRRYPNAGGFGSQVSLGKSMNWNA
jgi:hypothetical protein